MARKQQADGNSLKEKIAACSIFFLRYCILM
jgi:hypothetical protein